MSTIKATLLPDADGTVHLPLPPEFRDGPLRITATIERMEHPTAKEGSALANLSLKGFGSLQGKIWMAPDFDESLEDFKDYME